jgi:hypothetical protein
MVSSLLSYAAIGAIGQEKSTVCATLLTILAKHIPQAFYGSALLLEGWLRHCGTETLTTTATMNSLKVKNKDKKRTNTGTSSTMLQAQSEMEIAMYLFGLCVSTVRSTASAVAVPVTGPTGGEGSQEDALELCDTLVKLALKHNSSG